MTARSKLRLAGPVAAALVTGAVSLAVYLFTMPPTIVEGDGGELVAAARVLGIPHPTGYPLYMLLAKVFDLLPLANPAVRVSLLSACSAAGAAGAVAWAAAALTNSLPAGLVAGLVAALNRPMWSQATKPEVYALNALFISLAIALFVRWRLRARRAEILWLALVAGLSLAHHRTAAFLTLPLFSIALIGQRPEKSFLPKVAAAFVGPLLLYLYLPLRSAARPPVMWQDLSQWGNFVSHLLAREYYPYAFARPLSEAADLAGKIAYDFAAQLTLGGTVLALIGLAVLLWRDRAFSFCLIVASALLSVWNLSYDVPDVVDLFVPCWLAIAVCTAEGMTAAMRALSRVSPRWAKWLPTALAILVLVSASASLVQRNWPKCNRRGSWRDYDAERAILAQIPADGIYVPYRDEFVALYLQEVERYRRDVHIIRPTGSYLRGRPFIASPPLADALRAPVENFLTRASPGTSSQDRSRAALMFGAELAQAIDWDRAVYCGVDLAQPPRDIAAVAVWQDLYRATRERPQLLVTSAGPASPVELTSAVSLARCVVQPAAARRRDLLRIQLDFRIRSAVTEPLLLKVCLQPPGQVLSEYAVRAMLLQYYVWLAYGVLPLPATPPGSVCQQQISALVPTNAPAGDWAVFVGAASGPGRTGQLRRVGQFEVLAPDGS